MSEEQKPAQSGKKKKKKMKLKERVFKLVTAIFEELPDPAGKFHRSVRKLLRILIAAGQKFVRDEILIRATSIGYALVVSFVPTVIVLLLLDQKTFDIKQKFQDVKVFLANRGLEQLNSFVAAAEPKIMSLIDNAGAITGVGLIVVLFTATSVLRNLDNALNKIWRIKKNRPFIQKVGGFLLVLVFGPLVLSVGISMAQSLINQFASPDLGITRVLDDRVVILGTKHVKIEKSTKPDSKWKYESIINKTSYDTQKKPIVFSAESNKIVNIDARFKRAQKSELKFDTYKDITKTRAAMLMVTEGGNLLMSNDGGKNWSIRAFKKEVKEIDGSRNSLWDVSFERIHMFNNRQGLIFGNEGLILRTTDGGRNWSPGYFKVKNFFGKDKLFNQNIHDFAILGDTIYAVCQNYYVIYSKDRGETWKVQQDIYDLGQQVKTEDQEEQDLDLYGIHVFNNQIFITGEDGTLIKSLDGGNTWDNSESIFQGKQLRKITSVDAKVKILIGNNSQVWLSNNSGESWDEVELETLEELNHVAYLPKSKSVIFVGNAYHILSANQKDLTKISLIEKSPFWRVLVTAVGKVVLPFFVIFFTFFLIYKIMPNTLVSNMAAAMGATVTSLMWVIFIAGFRFYIRIALKGTTFIIYGTLAAIPLFLLLVYISTVLVLYGAEVSYFVQYPGMLKMSKKRLLAQESSKRQIWYGLNVLHRLFMNFETGRGESKESDLLKACNNDSEEFHNIMKNLIEKNIVQTTEEGKWVPVMSPRLIKMKELIDLLDASDFMIPDYSEGDRFKKQVKSYFVELDAKKTEVYQGATFADLLDKSLNK